MRALRFLLLLVSLAPAVGCRPKATPTEPQQQGTTEPRPSVSLPRPLPLPERPTGLLFLRDPQSIARAIAAELPSTMPPFAALLQQAGSGFLGAFERNVFPYVAFDHPWTGVQIQAQTILQVPIRPDALDDVTALLAGATPAGTFGAVRITRAAGEPGPKLAFLDKPAGVLTLADDLHGIATGYELRKGYGKQPIHLVANAQTAARFGVELPFSSVEIVGTSPHDFRLTTQGLLPELSELAPLAPGALTGSLQSPLLVVGASTRYAPYQADLQALYRDLRREISAQSFFVRGTLEDLFARFQGMSKHWNGRVMFGVAPGNHVMVGMGADNPQAAGHAALHLVAGVLENLKLAQMIGLGEAVPSLRFARNTAAVGEIQIHAMVLKQARQHVPREFHALIDERGDLGFAWAVDAHAGGALLVAGPQAPAMLQRWLQDTRRATPEAGSRRHLAAATVAVRPEQLLHVSSNPSAALLLRPSRPPMRVVLEQLPTGYDLRVQPL